MRNLFSPMNQLIQSLKDAEIPYHLLSKENDYIAIPRSVVKDTGIKVADKDGFILGIHLLERKGIWSVNFQMAARLVSETDPLYSKENTLKLLDGVKNIYVVNNPFLDENKTIPIEWHVEHDETMKTKDGQRFATVDGRANLGKLPLTSITSLLEYLYDFPEVELVNVTEMTEEEIQKELGII